MIYVIIGLAAIVLFFLLLIWIRKVQYDAVHRNFLDLVDNYGGRVLRGGFAVRPRFSCEYNGSKLSISISAEKKTKNRPRQFYISVFLQAPANANFTVMYSDWLQPRNNDDNKKRFTHPILNKKYVVEVTDKSLFKKLDLNKIEKAVKKLDPFAYVLVSRRGLILERLSTNLIKDTEIENLENLIEGVYQLSVLPVKGAS